MFDARARKAPIVGALQLHPAEDVQRLQVLHGEEQRPALPRWVVEEARRRWFEDVPLVGQPRYLRLHHGSRLYHSGGGRSATNASTSTASGSSLRSCATARRII